MTLRELRRELAPKKFLKQSNGGLIVSDVKLLASGTWTDSAFMTPCNYSEAVLEKYADNWVDKTLWVRHGGGVPRAITEKVGEIINPRYQDSAVVGDLLFHGQSQASRDTIEMVLAELANAVSVEHAGQEHWDADNDQYVAEELIFYGVAMVNRGACETCTIMESSNLRSSAEANDKMTNELETKLSEAESKIKELSDASDAKDIKLAELEAKLSEIDATLLKLADIETTVGKVAELETKLESLAASDVVKELSERIEKIEKTPLTPETFGELSSTSDLSSIDPFVHDNEGFTRRMF